MDRHLPATPNTLYSIASISKPMSATALMVLAQRGAVDLVDGIDHVHKVVNIDQTPIGRNRRSNPATFIGFYDNIGDLYTQAPLSVERDYKAGRFSFNVKGGRCEECQGEGVITTHLYFMPDVDVTCGACKGARFNSETLEVTVRGKTIDDVLNMSVEESVAFFAREPAILDVIKTADHVIDLGPEGGHAGGEVVATGTPEEIAACTASHTGFFLKSRMKAAGR